jgi:hypothetical protein
MKVSRLVTVALAAILALLPIIFTEALGQTSRCELVGNLLPFG